MDYAAAADALMRRKLLEEMYGRMTDEEKKLFIQISMQNKGKDEILQALQRQKDAIGAIEDKVSRNTWLREFSSNIAGNAAWNGLVWLGAWLLRK